MANLILHLKKEYFDQVASGAKVEEYRLVNPYWSRRLVGRTYYYVVLLCGYPARGDTSRQITRLWSGYTRKTITHPHFGESPVDVFAIDVSAPNTASTRPCPRCGCYGGSIVHYL